MKRELPELPEDLDEGEVRRLLDEVRDAGQPAREPDWDAMSRDIARACAEGARPVRRPWWTRPVFPAAAAALAAAVLLVVWLGRRAEPGPAAARPTAVQSAAAHAQPPSAHATEPARAAAEPPAADDEDRDDDDDGFEAFGSSEYLSPDELTDELDDADLEAIDRYIAQKG